MWLKHKHLHKKYDPFKKYELLNNINIILQVKKEKHAKNTSYISMKSALHIHYCQ